MKSCLLRPLILMAVLAICNKALPQDNVDYSIASGNDSSSGSADTLSSSGQSGGAAMADFGSLMNLIQTTIDPDNWLAAGGTSAMMPYPAGVWIDPAGRLRGSIQPGLGQTDLSLQARRPVQSPERTSVPPLDSDVRNEDWPSHAWHQSSKLRMISLSQLDRYLAAARRSPELITPELIRLSGLSQVQYVYLDIKHQDVIVAGPADANKAGCFIEDLAAVCALINQATIPFGCSIEPQHEQLLEAQRFIASAEAARLLGRSPQQFAQRLSELIDVHHAQIFGMNPQSITAVALLAADEHMKQVGFGKASLPIKVKSYFDFLDEQSSIHHQSLIRWWFDYSEEPLFFDEGQAAFQLPDDCIRLLSEQQLLTMQGRKSSGAQDPAADAFAEHFSQRLSELRRFEPNYSRMCCVFELALALQLALEISQMHDFAAWFPILYGIGQQSHQLVVQPVSVTGLVGWHRSRQQKTNVAVISGGVNINPKSRTHRQSWHQRRLEISPDNERAPDSDVVCRWWWDSSPNAN